MADQKMKIEPTEYLLQQQVVSPQFANYWTEFEHLHQKKLWHQLTQKIETFVTENGIEKISLTSLYENFIRDFESKMNPLSLVEIIAHIIKQMTDYQECLDFLESTKQKVKPDQNASLLCSILMAQLKLDNRDLDGVKAILEEIGPIITEQTGITPVHGRYFKISSNYYQLMSNHGEYFRNALRFLGCSNLENEPASELQARAFALSIAALLSDSIYNFGELLEHAIVNYLKGGNDWLYDLLLAFNSGDLVKFEQLRPQWTAQADLASKEIALREKISLLCLMEMTFLSSNGVLSFAEISEKTHLPITHVELLVMRALSLNLVKGTIDEVENRVNLHWVQPRVLNKAQISSLRNKIDSLSHDVRGMEHLMEQNVVDIGC